MSPADKRDSLHSLFSTMRIAGITIKDDIRLERALTAVYGLGISRAQEILNQVGISYDALAKDLSEADEKKIREAIESYVIEGDLKRQKAGNIKRLKDIESHRGMRHSRGLPVRGQRTKTNSRTVRGNVRKTMGSGRVKVEKK